MCFVYAQIISNCNFYDKGSRVVFILYYSINIIMYDSHYHCRFDLEHFVVSPASCLALSVSHYKGVDDKF